MPVRQSFKKVPTPVEIMGDDAYVTYRPITINEARELRQRSTEIQNKQNKALTEKSVELNKAVADLTDEEKSNALENAGLTDEMLSFVDREFSKLILEWNWVDDNGEALPFPVNDHTVLGTLYRHEYEYIMSLFNPDDKSEKN